jgi:hypothetical protein
MPTTMQLIAKQTVGAGGAASVTFSSIPQTFTDLQVLVSSRNTAVDTENTFSFNGSSANFSIVRLFGNGTTTGSDTLYGYSLTTTSGYTANTFSNNSIYIPNYTSSNFKSISIDGVAENNATASAQVLSAALWSNTAAITSIRLQPTSGTYAEGSEFTLYGISNSTTTQNPTTPSAIGGDTITTDGSFWYHAFKYSGSFTPLKNLTADVLVVAGGGGGGCASLGGGGGAGGFLAFTSQALSPANYSITVGAGGAGVSSNAGTTGNDSIFGVLTTVKGGGGGGAGTDGGPVIGKNGGSGGGGGFVSTGGTATSGQGNDGGANGYTGGATASSGGGGGAGAVGGTSNSNGSVRGNGGIGLNTYSTWATATSTGDGGYYAGGGGGATNQSTTIVPGGTGGGGAGSAFTGGSGTAQGANGLANTGGGAGGSNNSLAGGNGGSGIVIVRYAV